MIKQEKRNTNNPSVYLFRWKPSEDVWRRLCYLGCIDWQAEGWPNLKAPPLILRHIGIFSLPSNGINNIGKEKSLKSLSMFFSLGTEVRGTNTKSHHFSIGFFFSWPIPLPLKCSFSDHSWAEALPLMTLSPSQSLLLSSEVQANFSRSFFTPWYGSYWCQPLCTPTPQSGVGTPPPQTDRCTSPHLRSSFSDSQRKCKGTQIFQSHGVQSAHRNMQHPSQKVFYFSNPCPHKL